MKTLNIGVDMDEGSDFNVVVGVKGVGGPIDLTGYSFKGQMRSTTDPAGVVVGGKQSAGSYAFTGNPADTDTVTVNGVVLTFLLVLTGGPNEVQIGTTAMLTACNLNIFLRRATTPALILATYCVIGIVLPTLNVTYKTVGVVGNAFTLARNSLVITPSGTTLTGGIDPAEFVFTILNQFTNKGQVRWLLPQAIVDTIATSVSNQLQLTRLRTPYVFDVKMLDTAGTIKRIIQGIIYLSPQATQENFP